MRRQITRSAYDKFRKLLKEVRRSRSLTQMQLAQKLGVPQSFVSKTETGERRLDFVEACVLCDVMGVDFVEFAKAFQTRLNRSPSNPRSRG